MIIIAFLCALTLAGAAVYAELQKGKYQAAVLGQSAQAAAQSLAPDSAFAVNPYPLHPPELAQGDGKAEVEGYCSACHSTRYITMQPPLPAATWEAEVTKMKKTFGATIPDEATTKVLHYLQAHYAPETRKQ
jgi:mono/diheme cytochrome c family protein